MADVLAPRRGVDLWVGLSALTGAMLVLPFAQNSWHGPEVASALAVAAVALLAGQRWAIGLVAIAEALLLPTEVPRAFHASSLAWGAVHLGAIAMFVPGLLNARRAASALVELTGWRQARVRLAMATVVVLAGLLPMF